MTRDGAPPGHHGWFDFSALPGRPPVTWPGAAAVAVSVVIDLRAVEWEDDPDLPAVRPPGGRGIGRPPDVPRMSHREFGHRVGVFRLLDVLRESGVRPAVVLDVLTAEHYPRLLAHLLPEVDEVIAGGLSGSRPITSRMSDDEERHYVASTLDRLAAALPAPPRGWLSPEHSESARTPKVLAESGLGYVADWGNDEQPYAMPGSSTLWSYPLSWELSDLAAMHLRDVQPDTYASGLVEAFRRLCQDARQGRRVLGLHLHPWISGQPFRTEALRRALGTILTHPDAWVATPGEVVAVTPGAH